MRQLAMLMTLCVVAGCGSEPGAAERQERLQQTVASVEASVQSVWTDQPELTPSRVTGQVVRRLREAPEAASSIQVHEAQAFAPWQVAVVPDETRRVVRVEGYGEELSQPLIVREVAPGQPASAPEASDPSPVAAP